MVSALLTQWSPERERGYQQGLGGKAGYDGRRRLFLGRCYFRGSLFSGPGSNRSLGLRLMLIRQARRTGVVLGRGEREIELGRSRMVSYGVARLAPSGNGV